VPPPREEGMSASGADIQQSTRLIQVTSPLGADVLIGRRLTVRDAISRPYAIELEAVSTRDDIKPEELVGQTITVTLVPDTRPERHFHGMVRSLARGGDYGRGLTTWRIEAVPLLWLLSRTADCRIFQEASIKDIASKVLEEGHVAPVVWGTLPGAKRTYCTQFNEYDLDFLARVLGESGCGYFFRHEKGSHKLHVAGAAADYPQVGGQPFVARGGTNAVDSLDDWAPQTVMTPGKVTAVDYDMLKPSTPLEATADTLLKVQNAPTWEVFKWPGGQVVRPEGDQARFAMEAIESGADTFRATGHDPALFAGGKVQVKQRSGGAPQPFLITEAVHEAEDTTQLAGGGTSSYRVALTLAHADRPWRNPETPPRPPVAGLQAAIVTGPKGEEIHTDEYGRIKVRFLWDRKGKKDDGSSCWVRVAQPYAGAWGGAWFLPRIGDEVLVAFIDGDPDRPVVVGSLYNAEQKPPWSLPANKTQSGFKTRSSKKGGSDNANILRFEDLKGSEEIHVQAEKDLDILVKNDRTEEIKHDRTETVKGKHTETITGNRTMTIEQGNESKTLKQGNQSLELSMGNQDNVLKMGNQSTTLDMGNQSTKLKLGNQDTKADLGKIDFEAMQSITLKVGQSKITIDQMGVKIEGMQIEIKGQLMVKVDGLMVQQSGTAMMTIKGGIVMIN
jgi:type VI secretion system secreted protein VgrG